MGAGGGGGWSKLNYFYNESKCNFLWGVCGGGTKVLRNGNASLGFYHTTSYCR